MISTGNHSSFSDAAAAPGKSRPRMAAPSNARVATSKGLLRTTRIPSRLAGSTSRQRRAEQRHAHQAEPLLPVVLRDAAPARRQHRAGQGRVRSPPGPYGLPLPHASDVAVPQVLGWAGCSPGRVPAAARRCRELRPQWGSCGCRPAAPSCRRRLPACSGATRSSSSFTLGWRATTSRNIALSMSVRWCYR